VWAVALLEAGFGFTAPSYNTIVSWRVRQRDQGKAAAMMAVMSSLGAMLGSFSFSFFLHVRSLSRHLCAHLSSDVV
jgi:hypothetical protein